MKNLLLTLAFALASSAAFAAPSVWTNGNWPLEAGPMPTELAPERPDHVYMYFNGRNVSLECSLYHSYVSDDGPGSLYGDNCIVQGMDTIGWYGHYVTPAWNDLNFQYANPNVPLKVKVPENVNGCRFVAQAQMRIYTSKVFDCRG